MVNISFGFQTSFAGLINNELESRVMLIGYDSVQDGILYGGLELSHHCCGLKPECTHYLQTVNRGLEITYAVTLLQVHHLAAYQLEVLQMTLFFLLVLGGDIGLTQCHKVIYVIACIKQQTAYGRVSNLIINDSYGAHVQFNHLLHIFHLLILGQFHALKNGRDHLHAHKVVVIECPSVGRLPFLGTGLTDVMQQGGPAQPQVIAVTGYVIQHLKGMQEYILVAAAVHCLHALQCRKLREYQLQQTATVQVNESLGRYARQQKLVEFIGYTLTGYYLDLASILIRSVPDYYDEAAELLDKVYDLIEENEPEISANHCYYNMVAAWYYTLAQPDIEETRALTEQAEKIAASAKIL